MKLFAISSALVLSACGSQEYHPPTDSTPTSEKRIDDLEARILALSGTQSEINALISSDWASCSTSGPDALTTFQQNICRIAQAANIESRTQLKGELATLIAANEEKLNNVQNAIDTSSSSLVTLESDLAALEAQVSSVDSSLTSLSSQVNSNTTDIATLTSSVANINSQLSAVVNGAMIEITIGTENLAAGPLYESVLRNPSRTRITAYIESVDPNKQISNNGVSATSGSPIVIISSNAHGYSVGNVVKLNGLQTTKGLSSAVLNDRYVITAVTANTFTVSVAANASSNGSGGGNAGYVSRINGSGLGRAWQTSDGEVTKTTSFGLKPYNFIVTGGSTVFAASPGGTSPFVWVDGSTPVGSGWICYSISNRQASAATIKLGGSDVRCY